MTPPPGDFFDRLEEALFANVDKRDLPTDWLAFRWECERREEAGRDVFGNAYLHRANATEGREEAADGAMYSYFEARRVMLAGGDYEEMEQMALMAAKAFYEAHKILQLMEQRAHPVPFSEPSAI